MDYIINVGMEKEELEPVLAYPEKYKAIIEAKKLVNLFYEYAEVVYMPEDDVDTNDVVWRSWDEETEEDESAYRTYLAEDLDDED